MPRDEQYLKDVAQQYIDGLISLDEAIYILAGNETLTDEQQDAVDQAIADCRSHGAVANNYRSRCGGQAYAYPYPAGGIAWGFNAQDTGFCIARGIRD